MQDTQDPRSSLGEFEPELGFVPPHLGCDTQGFIRLASSNGELEAIRRELDDAHQRRHAPASKRCAEEIPLRVFQQLALLTACS
jgi:hypothetical protein